MKKTYIAPDMEIMEVKTEVIAASIESGGNTSGGGITEADAKEIFDFESDIDALTNIFKF
ncbi:MAG: hypothetical protein GXY64_05460 [Bacteroidales bacterium]|nr:hypothetical protein [Bacteroidales bacterium]